MATYAFERFALLCAEALSVLSLARGFPPYDRCDESHDA
jgi:hypothetical protein